MSKSTTPSAGFDPRHGRGRDLFTNPLPEGMAAEVATAAELAPYSELLERYPPAHEFHSWARTGEPGRSHPFEGEPATEFEAYLASGGKQLAAKLQRLDEEGGARKQLRSLGLPAPSIEELYRHAANFGSEAIEETAAVYLTPAEMLKLASRVNQVIDRAAKPKQNGEPRVVTSYRARIAEAKLRGNADVWLQRLKVDAPGEDPRVTQALTLLVEGEKSSIIAAKVGRSTSWVNKLKARHTLPAAA